MPFCGGETSKWDVKVTVSFCSCKMEQNTEGTNGGNQIEMSIMQWRKRRFHFLLSPFTLRFVKKKEEEKKRKWNLYKENVEALGYGMQYFILHFLLYLSVK